MLLRQKPPHIRTTPLVQRPWFIPLFGLIGALCWIATATSQPDNSHNGQPSKEHFTLSGAMPAQTALRASARYTPGSQQPGCPYQHPTLHFDTRPGAETQPFDFKVPTGYELPECQLYLSEVNFETEAFYGQDNLRRSIANNGTLTLRDNLQSGRAGFSASGEKSYQALCDWQDQFTHPGLEGMEPERMLDCYSVDEDWQMIGNSRKHKQLGWMLSREELEGKRIKLELRRTDQP